MVTSAAGVDGPHTTVSRRMARAQAGRVGSVQVVAVELAAMAVAGTAYAAPSHLAVVTGLAVMLLLPVVGRFRGRWWYEALAARRQMRRRRRALSRAARAVRASNVPESAALAPHLAALAPHLAVRTVTMRNMPTGVGEDELGWFAAIVLTPPDGLSGSAGGQLRLDWLTRQAGPLSTVQVVVRHTGSPASIDPHSPCAQSYQALSEALAVPPQQDVWIGVRLGLRDAAAATADPDGEVAGIHRTLGGALSRISDTLTSHGLAHRVLDGAGLQQAMLHAYGPEVVDGRHARESWSRWGSTRSVHVCFAVTDWPAHPLPSLLTELASVPGAVAVCTSIVVGAMGTANREDAPTGARLLVRVVAAPEMVRHCVRQLRGSARRLGVALVRLDGEQAPAVYATTPTAAPYGWGRPW